VSSLVNDFVIGGDTMPIGWEGGTPSGPSKIRSNTLVPALYHFNWLVSFQPAYSAYIVTLYVPFGKISSVTELRFVNPKPFRMVSSDGSAANTGTALAKRTKTMMVTTTPLLNAPLSPRFLGSCSVY
jgi:hypothetical protein